MQGARSVHVLLARWTDDDDPDGLNIERYLRCHGIDAVLHADAGHGADAAGDALLALARDVSADLLVMGCYGHSRARELVLGGATRTVLQSMMLPVLMAH
jgi:nucleotide-binding universal stress UspA family protein